MGHNGGFNPYRDANGEYATPAQAGKPGRKRGGGASAGSTGRTAPNALRGAKTLTGSPAEGDRPRNPGRGLRTRTGAAVTTPRDLVGHVREAQRLTKQYSKGVSKSKRSALSKAEAGGEFVSPPQRNTDGSHTVYRQGEHEVRVKNGFSRAYRNGEAGNSVNSGTGPGIASQVANVKGDVRNDILRSQGRAPHTSRRKGSFDGA